MRESATPVANRGDLCLYYRLSASPNRMVFKVELSQGFRMLRHPGLFYRLAVVYPVFSLLDFQPLGCVGCDYRPQPKRLSLTPLSSTKHASR